MGGGLVKNEEEPDDELDDDPLLLVTPLTNFETPLLTEPPLLLPPLAALGKQLISWKNEIKSRASVQ